MEEATVFVKKYTGKEEGLSRIREDEVWRYAGYRGGPEETEAALRDVFDEIRSEALPMLRYDVCFLKVPLIWEHGVPSLPFSRDSAALSRCLSGSTRAVMMAATIGIGIDRLTAKYERFHPTKALLLQAFGAERVEALCDMFCREAAKEAERRGEEITARFSPGYGDLPLAVQREFVQLLDCGRKIGVTLNGSLLMTPTKSVTAVFGIRPGRKRDAESASWHRISHRPM